MAGVPIQSHHALTKYQQDIQWRPPGYADQMLTACDTDLFQASSSAATISVLFV